MLLLDNVVGKRFKVVLTSDWHIGNIASSDDAINEIIEYIGVNNCYWIFGGDGIEAKFVGHPHYNPEIHEGKYGIVTAQCDDWCKKAESVRKRLLGYVLGNHELNKGVKPVINCGKYITEKLCRNIPYAFTLKMRLAEEYIQFYTHSKIYVNSKSGSQAQIYLREAESIKRKLWGLPGVRDAHVVACGHGHKLRLAPPLTRTDIYGIDGLHAESNNKYTGGHSMHPDSKYYCMTGSTLKTTVAQVYDPEADTGDILTYSEEAGYHASDMGFVLVTVDGGRPVNVEEIKL